MSRDKERKERIFVSTAHRIIADELKQALSITAEQADEVARQAVHSICKTFSKQTVYISSDREFELKSRDFQLWERFNGRNADEIAVEFNLSIVQVYKIIKIMRTAERSRTQPQLPGL